jgi:hypothetical protein
MKLQKKVTPRQVLIALAIVAVIYLMFVNNRSGYSVRDREYSMFNGGMTVGPSTEGVGCEMRAGTGLASSLLPREVAPQEDFGEFAPDDILSGQNFLEPRQQIGFPETIGGALRNANQQIRADPPNPKDAFVWNNSTIAPDMMQRSLCA